MASRSDDVSTTGTIAPAQAPRGSVASDKLRWPVNGKIITGFGQRNDGTHNDGINLSVPQGTAVHAAESGVVAYAGSELKGYGNLVLLRHDNGWVTAYAHNDELMVKRGDKVQRGQVIAKAGRTGSVDQPQVHFELRQGQSPSIRCRSSSGCRTGRARRCRTRDLMLVRVRAKSAQSRPKALRSSSLARSSTRLRFAGRVFPARLT